MKITDVRIRACSVSELTPSERGRLRGEAAPIGPGLGVDYDWDQIDGATVATF